MSWTSLTFVPNVHHPHREAAMTPREPLALGVCSWSLQVRSIPELKGFLDRLGIQRVQIACGDPHHADWIEGDRMPEAARSAGFDMTGAMLGFPGEDYTTPQTIACTGGFGDPALREERLQRLQWALERTQALGLTDLMFHGGFIPEPGSPDYTPFLQTLQRASKLAEPFGITLALETGQETSTRLRRFLDDLACANVKVNFDPANMLLYDMDEPLAAVERLGKDIRSVHVKDARRTQVKGAWGQEVPLGQGEVNIPAFVNALHRIGYRGPLCVEREVGTQDERFRDIGQGLQLLKECVAQLPGLS